MNDLLTTPTRDRLLFRVNLVTKATLEKTGQWGQSNREWGITAKTTRELGRGMEDRTVGNCGSNAAFASLSKTYRCTVQTAIAGSLAGPQRGSPRIR